MRSLCLLILLLAPRAWAWTLDFSVQQPAPDGLAHILKKISEDDRSCELRLVVFPTKNFTVRVVDDRDHSLGLDGAMRSTGALAGVNGGYFHPDDTPLGLVVINGKIAHPLEHAKLLSGILVATRGGVALRRVAEFVPSLKITAALQAGPFLVDKAAPVAGLNDARRAARTVVLSDGAGRMALLSTDSLSLAELARALTTPGLVTELKIQRALNLDGGSSTALWIRNGEGSSDFHVAPWKQVRNYLGVYRR